jgi:hypothetical protein
MKSGFFFCTLIVAFSVSFVPDCLAACEAYEILGDSRWYGTHPQPPYTISILNVPSYLDNEGVVSHMQVAASSWSMTAYWFDFQENGSNQAFVNAIRDCEDQTNPNNLFGWDDWGHLFIAPDGKLSGRLGITRVCKTQTQGNSGRWLIDFVHSILNYGIDDGSGSYKWSLNPPPPTPGNYQFDVQSISAHEFGHWLNLTHTPTGKYSSFPTMEQVGDVMDLAGSTAMRSLECEDQWGINEIYDGSSSAPPRLVSDVHHANNPPSNLMSIRPRVSMLHQNVPNPANPETWIPFELSQEADVIIRIYNASGLLIRTLDLGHKAAGFYTGRDKAAYWDGHNAAGESVASGVYYYHLGAGDFSATRKMLILK